MSSFPDDLIFQPRKVALPSRNWHSLCNAYHFWNSAYLNVLHMSQEQETNLNFVQILYFLYDEKKGFMHFM